MWDKDTAVLLIFFKNKSTAKSTNRELNQYLFGSTILWHSVTITPAGSNCRVYLSPLDEQTKSFKFLEGSDWIQKIVLSNGINLEQRSFKENLIRWRANLTFHPRFPSLIGCGTIRKFFLKSRLKREWWAPKPKKKFTFQFFCFSSFFDAISGLSSIHDDP